MTVPPDPWNDPLRLEPSAPVVPSDDEPHADNRFILVVAAVVLVISIGVWWFLRPATPPPLTTYYVTYMTDAGGQKIEGGLVMWSAMPATDTNFIPAMRGVIYQSLGTNFTAPIILGISKLYP